MKLTALKSLKARMLFGAVIGVLGIIGAQRQQAWANDIAYRDTVYQTDFATAGVGGLRNTGRGTIVLTGVTGTVSRAFLYWAGPMNVTDPLANANITFAGRPLTGQNIGFSDDNCWGYRNSAAYRADVTALVQRNGTYPIGGMLHNGTNINANGASLLVFYNDNSTANDRDIVYFDGNDSNASNPYDSMGWNVSLKDIRYTTGKGSIQLHASDGQAYPDRMILLNGRTLASEGAVFQGQTVRSANNGPINNGNLWDIRSWDVTSFLATGTNALNMRHENDLGSDCIALVVAVINLPAGAAPPPLNHAPVVAVEPRRTVNTPNPTSFEALATDIDGDPLTGYISVNGTMLRTNVIAATRPITSGMLSLSRAFTLGQHIIAFSVDDGKEMSQGVMVLEVVDNTPPVLHLPTNIVVRPDSGKTTAVVSYIVTATDDFPGVTVVSTPPSGSTFPAGVTTVNATAVDGSGNMTRGSFTVTVIDSVPPVIACPATNIVRRLIGTNSAQVTYTVTATDNLPGVTVRCEPPSGSLFPPGATRVNCLARDVAGNTASCQFLVTILDCQPPIITPHTNMIVATDLSQCAALVNYVVTVRDNVPGSTLVCAPPSGSIFPSGMTRVVCRATDAAGNRATNGFTVTVVDREKPVLTLPADIRVGCSGCERVTYRVTATDNCSAVCVVCTPPSGSTFVNGTNIVRCTGTDAAGNAATGTFRVLVADTEPPVIRYIKSSITKLCPPNRQMVPMTLKVTATDNCGGPVTSRIVSIECNEPMNCTGPRNTCLDWTITGPLSFTIRSESGGSRAGRLYTVTVESKDARGNATRGTTTVTVKHAKDDKCDDKCPKHHEHHDKCHPKCNKHDACDDQCGKHEDHCDDKCPKHHKHHDKCDLNCDKHDTCDDQCGKHEDYCDDKCPKHHKHHSKCAPNCDKHDTCDDQCGKHEDHCDDKCPKHHKHHSKCAPNCDKHDTCDDQCGKHEDHCDDKCPKHHKHHSKCDPNCDKHDTCDDLCPDHHQCDSECDKHHKHEAKCDAKCDKHRPHHDQCECRKVKK